MSSSAEILHPLSPWGGAELKIPIGAAVSYLEAWLCENYWGSQFLRMGRVGMLEHMICSSVQLKTES